MARDKSNMMWVDGVTPETKEQLKAIAQKRFGKANASLLVRHLISECLNNDEGAPNYDGDLSEEVGRIELRFPVSVLRELEVRSELKLCSRNYYIGSLVYRHLGNPQLHGDEIEALRKSNYDLAKIGTNLNQIAKAFNLLVLAGGGGKLPEIGKKIAALRTEIKSHTSKVLRVLEAGTAVHENNQAKRARARPPKKKWKTD